jgi:tripartite ATP-independent transporter DctP family solute receptor
MVLKERIMREYAMRKRFYLSALLIVCAGLIAGCGKGGNRKTVIKLACVLPSDHPTGKALQHFEKRAEKLSDGKIDVRLFLNSQLGNSTDTIESCRSGNIEMIASSAAPLAQFSDSLNILTMPFIFRDKQHEYAVLDGPIGKEFDGKLQEVNFNILAFFDAGSRNITTKKGPVKSPDNLRGMKIRVMPSKLMIDTINALGGSAVAMGQGEVYSALQTGVLDGWENNPPTILTFKMYETGCKYFAWTRHLSVPDLLLINREFYTSLDDDLRAAIDQAAKETQFKQRELWQKGEAEAVEKLKQAGMVFNEVDHQLFAARVKNLYKEYYDKNSSEFKDLCEKIRLQK